MEAMTVEFEAEDVNLQESYRPPKADNDVEGQVNV
jgi:hypothetical protein